MISETKLDSSFPAGPFLIHWFSKPYRFDRNSNRGGILLYIREYIPLKLIDTKTTVEGLFVEVNLRGEKWIIGCFYNLKTSLISSHLNEVGPNLDLLPSRYENFLLLGNFNAEPTTITISDFCEIYNLKNIIKDKGCFKNPSAPTLDLMITNRPRSFKHSVVVETGLSDFRKVCVTVMKTYYSKQKPSIVQYRKFTNFFNETFLKDLKSL